MVVVVVVVNLGKTGGPGFLGIVRLAEFFFAYDVTCHYLPYMCGLFHQLFPLATVSKPISGRKISQPALCCHCRPAEGIKANFPLCQRSVVSIATG